MANIVFNIAKGRVGQLALLTAANDALVAVVLDSTGIEADATLQDYDTLAAILAASNNEHTTLTRVTPMTGVTSVQNDTSNLWAVDADDLSWSTPAAGSGATAKLVICYDPDTTGGSDSDLIPLVALDFGVTPSGTNNVTFQFNAGGFYQAA